MVSLGRSLVSQRSADERTHLFLPRDGFRDLASLLDAAEAQPLNSPLGRFLGDYVLLLRDNLPDLTLSDMSRFTGAVRSMVFACLAPTSDSLEEAGPQINLTRREQVRQFIDQNLRNPGLNARLLCRELGLSRTQLYRLFAQDHGVAHYVRYRRLLSCYVLLSDPSNALAINVIADTHCFEDASSFSRAFKQEFGHNPRDVRAAAVSGQHIADKRDEPFGEPRTLNEYLKGL
ncbi:MAG: helix-turn-helix domain-containing protein [Kaiparowitsia implicata GSE-PSE-MK54-09C]|nr:helix-turn-helix domain-containing protein [Kaiparowitsia implicata GSE-PSE-MK54-09C]